MPSVTFNYTGSDQTWAVPGGITVVSFDVRGGGESPSSAAYPSTGSAGGRVTGLAAVSPGLLLHLLVGGYPADASLVGTPRPSTTGGWPDGGDGGGPSMVGSPFVGQSSQWNPGGSGSSSIRIGGTALANRVVVAGGTAARLQLFGGAGSTTGGHGGNPNGDDGAFGATAMAGHGATAGAVGAGGTTTGGSNGTAGSGPTGGHGGAQTSTDPNGDPFAPGFPGNSPPFVFGAWGSGGGGGYFGGGGGGAESPPSGARDSAPGGGGSSWVDTGLCSAVAYGTDPFLFQHGKIILTWTFPPTYPQVHVLDG